MNCCLRQRYTTGLTLQGIGEGGCSPLLDGTTPTLRQRNQLRFLIISPAAPHCFILRCTTLLENCGFLTTQVDRKR
ncbi:hypothetical protein SKAU_G00066880 [Synaphobranchus kaupii]|uniref:Uncharacterized protein n=1 Tax=Synaphobranchus kaupii TaxID=118154 RepID=A0A9Q1G6V7_SYNKA|nr:hypothetical protein SKAU_G00066880 [Synaphobranchus kaupii]